MWNNNSLRFKEKWRGKRQNRCKLLKNASMHLSVLDFFFFSLVGYLNEKRKVNLTVVTIMKLLAYDMIGFLTHNWA